MRHVLFLPENLSDAFKPFFLPLSQRVSRQTGMMICFMYHPCIFLARELICNHYASSDKKGVQKGKEKKFVTFKRIEPFCTCDMFFSICLLPLFASFLPSFSSYSFSTAHFDARLILFSADWDICVYVHTCGEHVYRMFVHKYQLNARVTYVHRYSQRSFFYILDIIKSLNGKTT